MITVISGTNRTASVTQHYADHYTSLLQGLNEEAQLLDLSTIDFSWFSNDMYHPDRVHPELLALQKKYILEPRKIVVFAPEYNGSYPGVLKLFIDSISVHEYARNWKGKVIALVGIASGRAGNLRGLDHLAQSIAHMGGWILPNRLPISQADKHLTDGKVTEPGTLESLNQQAEQLIVS